MIYHNLDATSPLADELAADVVMRSAAAPTYFPSFQRRTHSAALVTARFSWHDSE
jgi:patatin-like phospholipase/acyl hydrolase